MSVVRAAVALVRHLRPRGAADWYEPLPASPLTIVHSGEGELVRRLLAGEISRDRYRQEIERLAA